MGTSSRGLGRQETDIISSGGKFTLTALRTVGLRVSVGPRHLRFAGLTGGSVAGLHRRPPRNSLSPAPNFPLFPLVAQPPNGQAGTESGLSPRSVGLPFARLASVTVTGGGRATLGVGAVRPRVLRGACEPRYNVSSGGSWATATGGESARAGPSPVTVRLKPAALVKVLEEIPGSQTGPAPRRRAQPGLGLGPQIPGLPVTPAARQRLAEIGSGARVTPSKELGVCAAPAPRPHPPSGFPLRHQACRFSAPGREPRPGGICTRGGEMSPLGCPRKEFRTRIQPGTRQF